jgi:predicted helicase
MRHMPAGENVALIVPRQNKGDFGAFATTVIGTHKTVAAFDINSYFPLYLYPTDSAHDDLFSSATPADRRPNLNPELLATLANAYGEPPTPEEILHYVYAILYAPSYRERYVDFLRLDFPRIPFPAARELFTVVAGLGARLAALHLLRSPELDPPLARFEGQGENGVAGSGREGLRYEEKTERVFINATQYFAPVPPEVWEYAIGGYQVAEKWLKDRRDRRLTLDEIRTYCRIVTALHRTIALQTEIDAYYAQIEDQTLPLGNTLPPHAMGNASRQERA